jgi:hypothetical protein
MKAIISMFTTICGTVLLIMQYRQDGGMGGGPIYCEVIGSGLCLAGVIMSFMVVGMPAENVSRQSAAA